MTGLTFYGRLGKFTWRMCALVLASQSILVFFGALVAWGIAKADQTGAPTAYLVVGSLFAVGCIVAAGLMTFDEFTTGARDKAATAGERARDAAATAGDRARDAAANAGDRARDAAAAAREGQADTLTP